MLLLAVPLALAACSAPPDRAITPATPAAPVVPEGGIDPATTFTPVSVTTMTTPSPVTASDGRTHLAYELLVTNATGAPYRLDKVEVLDATDRKPITTLDGAALAADANLIGGPVGDEGTEDPQQKAQSIPNSATAVVWLDVVPQGPTPTALVHRITGSIGGSPAITSTVGRVDVSTQTAPVLGPPVAGGGQWYASDGCCADDSHHRRGLAPINGTLLVPQRFAIDWYLLDDQHRAWVDDPSKITNFLAYDQAAIASADGVVVDAVDGLPDTTSLPKPPPLPPIKDTVGNHVTLMIAPGVYLLYAHFKPGTVAVERGQKVKKGDVLGHIGSSGNSTAPHLHFQVMTEPTFFPTDSTPFAFDCFRLDGRVTERIWDDVLPEQPTPVLPFAASNDTAQHKAQMPLDRSVLTFC
ncbi:M23 family metallopeptidase [Pseudonocardia ailaonensis]|uniref:M23 family metallopeptidase n=1 Tax=Pseudonocardia ailaonensis TaxID=367279 RepID=A0ABN2N2C3_9PSEU